MTCEILFGTDSDCIGLWRGWNDRISHEFDTQFLIKTQHFDCEVPSDYSFLLETKGKFISQQLFIFRGNTNEIPILIGEELPSPEEKKSTCFHSEEIQKL
jgi:hypothetical protein